ncbi:MAG: hypothetical protein HY827_07885, partial [Actinobacteria bacterium]|nr:hypothetical protein [Actinomycetota bacterium]
MAATELDHAYARRRLALLYVGGLAATILVSIGHALVVNWVREEWVSANTLSAVIVAPPLIFLAYRAVSTTFAGCLAATAGEDVHTKRVAIDKALALPARATLLYVAAWAAGLPLGFVVSVSRVEPTTTEVVAYFTDICALIPVAGFPIYAIVESRLRPVLRLLFEQVQGQVAIDEIELRRFGVSKRVGLAMGSLVFAIAVFLSSKTIGNAFGAGLDPGLPLGRLGLQLPVFALMTAMVGVSVTVSLRGSIHEVERAIRAAADGDLRRRAA